MFDSEEETSSSHASLSTYSVESRCEGDPEDRSAQPSVVDLPPRDEGLTSQPPLPTATTNVKVNNSQNIIIGNIFFFDKDAVKIEPAGGNDNGILSGIFNKCFPCIQVNEGASENKDPAIEAEPTSRRALPDEAVDLEKAIETLIPEGIIAKDTVKTSLHHEWGVNERKKYSIFRCCFLREVRYAEGAVETFEMTSPEGVANTNSEGNAKNLKFRQLHSYCMKYPALRLGVTISMILIFSLACGLVAAYIARRFSDVDVSNNEPSGPDEPIDTSTVSTWSTDRGGASDPTPIYGPSTPPMDETPELDRDTDWRFFGLTKDEIDLYGTTTSKQQHNITSTSVPTRTSGWTVDAYNTITMWTGETYTTGLTDQTNTSEENTIYTTSYLQFNTSERSSTAVSNGISTTTSVPTWTNENHISGSTDETNNTKGEDNTTYTTSYLQFNTSERSSTVVSNGFSTATPIPTLVIPHNISGWTDETKNIKGEKNATYTTT